jgi:hypothetical protein
MNRQSDLTAVSARPSGQKNMMLNNALSPTPRRKDAKTQGFRLLGTFTRWVSHPENSSWPTTKSAKNARKGTWERDGLHPPGDRVRLPNRLFLFEFFAFFAVKLFRLGSFSFKRANRKPRGF